MAGWCFQFPEFTAPQFVLAHKALKAWRRLKPSHGRHPLPWAILCACAAWIALEVGLGPAVSFLVMFDAYLRPYELQGIRLMDVCDVTG